MTKLFNVATFVDYHDVEIITIRADDSVEQLYQLERKLVEVGREYFPEEKFTISDVLYIAKNHDEEGVFAKHGLEIVETETLVTDWTEKFR